MAVMTLKSINPDMYVCAEVINTKFEHHLQLSHCDEIVLSREYSRLEPVAQDVQRYQQLLDERRSADELSKDSDADMAAMGKEELQSIDESLESLSGTLMQHLIPVDPNDSRSNTSAINCCSSTIARCAPPVAAISRIAASFSPAASSITLRSTKGALSSMNNTFGDLFRWSSTNFSGRGQVTPSFKIPTLSSRFNVFTASVA